MKFLKLKLESNLTPQDVELQSSVLPCLNIEGATEWYEAPAVGNMCNSHGITYNYINTN